MVTTPQMVEHWAAQATQAFMAHQVSDINHGVAKVARAEQLTPTQIARTCEKANHQVFAQAVIGTKTAEGQQTVFDPARPDVVLGLLNQQQPVKQAAPSDVDYHLPPPSSVPPLDLDRLWAPYLETDPSHPAWAPEQKLAREQVLFRQKQAEDQTHAAIGHLRGNLMGHTLSVAENEERFYQEVKKLLLRGKNLSEVYRDLIVAPPEGCGPTPPPPPGAVQSMLGRIADRLRQENLIEEGAEVPPLSPSQDIPLAGVESKIASHHLSQALYANMEAQVTEQAIHNLERKEAGLRLPKMPSLARQPSFKQTGARPAMRPQPVRIPKNVVTSR